MINVTAALASLPLCDTIAGSRGRTIDDFGGIQPTPETSTPLEGFVSLKEPKELNVDEQGSWGLDLFTIYYCGDAGLQLEDRVQIRFTETEGFIDFIVKAFRFHAIGNYSIAVVKRITRRAVA